MPLTPKQGRFAQLVALEGLGQSAAYRQAYSTGNMKPEAIWVESSRLTKNPKVALRIEELRQGLIASTGWDRKRLVAELENNSIRAAERHQFGPSIRALELIGKAEGLFNERPSEERPTITRIVVVLDEGRRKETRILDAPYVVKDADESATG